jgi:hypothetical protein
MPGGSRYLSSLLLAAALASPLAITGCAVRARVYDPYYHDYHHWNHDEIVYYQNWERESHREHRDFRQRNSDEQKEYWDWRHKH